MTSIRENPVGQSWRKRFHAWMLAHASPALHRHYAGQKAILFSSLSGRVVEIGAGTGVNLAYYPRDIRWVGIEPNPYMVRYLTKEADRREMNIELYQQEAPHLSLPDDSADAVVTTLVLCTVGDVEGTVREIRRILVPGGRYIFIEHVAAPAGTLTRRFQDLLCPVWSRLADGCQPNRELWRALDEAGFRHLEYTHFWVPIPIAGPHIAGMAIK